MYKITAITCFILRPHRSIRAWFLNEIKLMFENGLSKRILYGETSVPNGLSDEISKGLKKRGFKYLGNITIYSRLQACGIINDHRGDCPCYQRIVDKYPMVRKRRYLEVY